MNKISLCIAAFLISVALFFGFSTQREAFQKTHDLHAIGERYSQSQYVLGDTAPLELSDEEVYLFAADTYRKGQDPTKVNFEHPPFGKYVIGLSLSLFHNGATMHLVLLPLTFFLLFLIAKKAEIRRNFALLFLFILALTQMYYVYAGTALLDILQLFLTTLLLFLLVTKKSVVLTGVTLGLLLSVKYPFPIIFLYSALVLLFQGKKTLSTLFIALLTYLSTYIVYFKDHSPIDFLRFEWYRFRWWTGERTMPKFLILSTLFLGKFKTWWDDGYQFAEHWNIFWPISCIASLCSLPLLRNKVHIGIALYTFGLLALYAVGSAAYERYLLQILPFFTLLSIFLVQKIADTSRNSFS